MWSDRNNVPTVTGTVTHYAVNPTLPAGLKIDSVLGVISGTPTVVTALGNYVVRSEQCTDGDGHGDALRGESDPTCGPEDRLSPWRHFRHANRGDCAR